MNLMKKTNRELLNLCHHSIASLKIHRHPLKIHHVWKLNLKLHPFPSILLEYHQLKIHEQYHYFLEAVSNQKELSYEMMTTVMDPYSYPSSLEHYEPQLYFSCDFPVLRNHLHYMTQELQNFHYVIQ